MLRRIPGSIVFICLSLFAYPQEKLSVHWEELTAPDFARAIDRSQGTCVLPFGILGETWCAPSARHRLAGCTLRGSSCCRVQEYAVVFPEYYFRTDLRSSPRARNRGLQFAVTALISCRRPPMKWPATAARRLSLSMATAATSTCCRSLRRVS